MIVRVRWAAVVLSLLALLTLVTPLATPIAAQGGAGTKDFPIRDFGACINLPDFAVVTEPDAYNSLYTVPGLFEIKFAEYLMPLAAMPNTGDEIYNAMIALLDTVSASDYVRISFDHPQYVSAAVEFTLDGQRMFGMIYRNQDDKLFFLFADKVEGFDMLAIGRAIFAADSQCNPLPGYERPTTEQSASETTTTAEPDGEWLFAYKGYEAVSCAGTQSYSVPIDADREWVDIWAEDGGYTLVLHGLDLDRVLLNPNLGEYSGDLALAWDEEHKHYTTDITGFMNEDWLLEQPTTKGVYIKVTMHSDIHGTGGIVVWVIDGPYQCSYTKPFEITLN